jgi:hypothetical protein
VAGPAVRQVKGQAIGNVFVIQEFDIKFANPAIADYGDTDRRAYQAETIADYPDKFYELALRANDFFEIASDVDNYALHKYISLYCSCSGGISGGFGYAIRP